MAIIEALITGVGAAVAKTTLKLWLDDREVVAAASGSFADILIKKVPDLLRRNKTERTFESIRDLSANSIRLLLETEAADISDDRLAIISNAAAETLSNTPLDIDVLVKHNLNKDELVEYFLSRTGADGANPALAGKDPDNNLFPPEEQLIYRRILTHASQLIVDMSSNFPQFEESVNAELLQRTSSMAEQVVEGMNRVVEEQADAFEADYRNACVRKWDQLELFGVDLHESNQRYNLSVAYVTLMVERIGGADDHDHQPEDEEADVRDSMSADAALASHQRLFVRGPAGSGKTTLLQWFAVFAAARRLDGDLSELNDCVPFLIKLRDFAEEELPAPEDFPKEASKALGGNAPSGWVHDRLRDGRALVLIDGLDEASEKRRKEVREWLRDLTNTFPKARYVITSRPHAAEEGWLEKDEFIDAELQDMARSDVHEFIDHWHAAVSEAIQDKEEKEKLNDLSDSLKQKLGKNGAIYRLATSPLLCALLCALHRQRVKNLPSDRIELYQLCIEMFFRRDEERGIDDSDYISLSTRQMEKMLQEFAWWMIRNSKTAATPEETVMCFQRQFDRLKHPPDHGNGQRVMDLFLHRIGIIRQLAHQKIDFPHRTFQEFLAAKAATEVDDLGALVNHAHDDQWQELVILACGLLPSRHSTKLVQDLLKRGDDDRANQHALYLVAVAALEVIVAGEDDSVEREVEKRLNKLVPPKNVTAAKRLAAAGDLVVPFLAFSDELKVNQAAACVRALAMIGTEQAHELLKGYAGDWRGGVMSEFISSFKFARDIDAYGKVAFYALSMMELHSIDLSGTSLSNLSTMGACTSVERIRLARTAVSDLSPLSSCTHLQSLDLHGCPVKDLSPLSSCTGLQFLNLRETCISDLAPLSSCTNLKVLSLAGATEIDLTPLRKCSSLQSLNLGWGTNYDLQPLSFCSSLEQLSLIEVSQIDLSPLRSCSSLEKLDLVGMSNLDLTPLSSCPRLKQLSLILVSKLDLSPLVSCQYLERLDINRMSGIDLSPLGTCASLKQLSISGESGIDLSFLGSLPNLELLELSGMSEIDLLPLSSCKNLKSLSLFYVHHVNIDELRTKVPSLNIIHF